MRSCRLWSIVPGMAVVSCAAVLLFSFASPALAQEKSWRISNLDEVLTVQQNGDVVADETYTFAFQGNYHFVERVIPLANMHGMKDIQVLQNGVALPTGDTPDTWSMYKEGGNEVIHINFDITDASGTWTFQSKPQ